MKRPLETVLATIEAEIKAVIKRIEELIDQNPDLKGKKKLLTSIPGIGDTTAIRILAEMYDLSEYKDAKAAVRSALYFPAITAIKHNPVVRKMATRLANRGKHKAVIRVAAMRKLLHLAYGVLKNQCLFDPAYGR